MEDSNILFELIREHKFDDFKNIMQKDKDNLIDINIRDEQNNYLLFYVILFNRIDLVKLLIEKGARIDITDNEDKSILFIPIKYDYLDIIKIILETNVNNIGISIHDIKDRNNNISIHYAIIYKNTKALKLMLEYGSNPNITDKNGNNSLHLAVYSRIYEICKYILNYNIDINSKTNIGESALHIASNLQESKIFNLLIEYPNININSQDYDHGFTPIHYSVILNNLEQVTALLKKNANPNIQDIYGNTILHYSLIEENIKMVNIIIDFKYKDFMVSRLEAMDLAQAVSRPEAMDLAQAVNFNLWNIDGKLPLHIIFSINPENIILYIDKLIDKTNINIPDNEGNTCLFFLCKYNLWKKYKNILITKKLDITISNIYNERPIDFINEKDIQEFNSLVTESYLNRLRNVDAGWMEEWQNICNKELLVEHLDQDKSNIISKLNITLNKNIDKNIDICKKIVDERIRDIIKNKNIDKCLYKSYPLKQGYICLRIEDNINLNMCTFTGSTLDILIGLMYLLKKHPDSCSTLNTDFAENKKLCNFYKSMGVSISSRCEFMNFEIVWVYNKLYLTDSFYVNFKKCIQSKDKRFIIIPVGIEMKEGSHANYLIFDKKLNQIERFEPHGSSEPIGFNYNSKLLDQILENRIKDVDANIEYISPEKFLPKIGFQMLDIIEKKNKKIGDPGGFCALWAIWYVDMRITYKDIPRKKLVNKMIKQIRSTGLSFRNIIRNYSSDIISIRDKYFKEIGIDINDWINDKVNDEEIKIMIKSISNDINKLI